MVLKEELLTDEVKVRRMIEVQGRKSSRKRKEVKEEVKEEEGYIRGRKKKFKAQRMIEGVRRTIHINPDVRTLDWKERSGFDLRSKNSEFLLSLELRLLIRGHRTPFFDVIQRSWDTGDTFLWCFPATRSGSVADGKALSAFDCYHFLLFLFGESEQGSPWGGKPCFWTCLPGSGPIFSYMISRPLGPIQNKGRKRINRSVGCPVSA